MPNNNLSQSDRPESVAKVDAEPVRDCDGSVADAKRRRLAKFGLGAPILMTIASRPVLAAQCMSNMMSGNLSNPNRGNCSKGWSPGGWGQPGGMVSSYSTTAAWAAINLNYGGLGGTVNAPSGLCSNANQYDCYFGGATMANVPGVLNQNSVATTVLLREVLTQDNGTRQKTRHLVCAYLNALLSELQGSTFHYILSTDQVKKLANGTIVPPVIPPSTTPLTLTEFLDWTWKKP